MLIRSISGVRGIVKTSLTADVIIRYARSFHFSLPIGAIIVGRDSRQSGEEIRDCIIEELTRIGRNIIDCGIVPTPTVQFMVYHTEAIGGLVITASHNPVEWNGLKFLKKDGTFFGIRECEFLFEKFDSNEKVSNTNEPGMIWTEKNAIQKHVISCASLKCINLNRIQRRKFRIVIDAVNGGGAIALPMILESMGCEVIKLNCEPNGNFTRGTEPLPENLDDLKTAVQDYEADAGFAVDPDADRLAIVNERGEALGEEYTLVLAADGYICETNCKETFVTNLSTSYALDKLSEKYGCSVIRSAVGEINVVDKMKEVGANLGGEGNGGVILKDSHLGRDSLVAVTMVLNRMSQDDVALSEMHRRLPQFKIVKDKINIKKMNYDQIADKLKIIFSDANFNNEDGLKFFWEDQWLHLRKSNTEPIIRIYAEAPKQKQAEEMIAIVHNSIEN